MNNVVGWVRQEVEKDLEEWQSDRPVRRTVVGLFEMVFAIGIAIRAGMHVGGVMIAYPRRFGDVEPEVRVGLQPGHTIVRDLPWGVDLSSRALAVVYALWFLQHPPSIIPLSPGSEAALMAYFGLNLGFVVLDPVWFLVGQFTK